MQQRGAGGAQTQDRLRDGTAFTRHGALPERHWRAQDRCRHPQTRRGQERILPHLGLQAEREGTPQAEQARAAALQVALIGVLIALTLVLRPRGLLGEEVAVSRHAGGDRPGP